MNIFTAFAKYPLTTGLSNQILAILEHDGLGVFNYPSTLSDTPYLFMQVEVNVYSFVFVYHVFHYTIYIDQLQ